VLYSVKPIRTVTNVNPYRLLAYSGDLTRAVCWLFPGRGELRLNYN